MTTAGAGDRFSAPSTLEGVLGVEVVEGLLDASLHGLLALANPDTRVGVLCAQTAGSALVSIKRIDAGEGAGGRPG